MLLLDFLLLIMVTICVGYCWVLNRRIHDLQNSRIEFARMIKELNASIVKAENNVNEMTELSKVTSTEIKVVVEEAKEATLELAAITEMANQLSEQLSAQFSFDDSKEEEEADSEANSLHSKESEKFTDEDLAVPAGKAEGNGKSYTNDLKNFITNIVTKKPEDQGVNLNQMNYYDTLRKINAHK